MCGGSKWPGWLRDKARDKIKDEVTERALEQCNKRYEGDCSQLCECVYVLTLASCGGPTNTKCVMNDATTMRHSYADCGQLSSGTNALDTRPA